MAERALRRLSRESGFTLIELLVTITVLAIGVMAVVGTFDFSRGLTTTAEKNEVASHYAEAEMERILALDYKTIALPGTLTPSGNPSDPDYYVNGGGSSYQWDQGPTGPQSDALVIDSANSQVQHISTWNDAQSRLSGSIYRYVTQVPGTNGNSKRVTIAVTVNGKGLTKPVLISSKATDPQAGTG